VILDAEDAVDLEVITPWGERGQSMVDTDQIVSGCGFFKLVCIGRDNTAQDRIVKCNDVLWASRIRAC
jgi:hypothetical protein